MADDDLGNLGVPANAPKPKSKDEALGDLGVPAAAEVKPEDRSILEPYLGRDYLANKPDDTIVDQALKLTGTALSRAPFVPVGMIGDLRDFARYGVDRIASKVTGKSMEELQERAAKNREKFPSWMDRLPTTRELSDEFLKQAGTKPYEPTSLPGKVAMGVIEGAGGATNALQGAAARGIKIPELALETSQKMAVPAGIAAGAGTAVTEVTGDPLLGAVTSIGTAPVAAKVLPSVGEQVPKLTPGQQQRAADQQLKGMATDPHKVAYGSEPDPLGVKTTTGATHGDKGLLQNEQILAGTDVDFATKHKSLHEKANEVAVKTINDLRNPNARPMDVVKHFDDHIAGVDAHTNALVAQAEKQAASVAGQSPEARAIDEAGHSLQEAANARMKQAREMRSRAYDAVDPDGTMHVVGTPAVNGAQKFLAEWRPEFGDLNSVVKSLYEKVAGWRDVVPYKGVMQMDATINGAIGEARRAGNHTVVDQLGDLKKLVKGAADKALENQIKWEQAQVKAGAMPQENTIGYRLAQEAEAFRDARRSAGTSAAVAGAGVPLTVSGPGRAEGPRGGSRVPPGSAGVEGDAPVPNLDPAAAVQWQRAKELHGDFSDTFRKGPVGNAIEGVGNNFDMPGSKAAQSAFVAGDAGAENVRSWLRADDGSTNIPATVSDIATTRLREMMEKTKTGEVLTPEILQAWKVKYGPALSAIDEAIPGFSSRFDNVASANRAVGDARAFQTEQRDLARQGVAAKFMGLTHPTEVVAKVNTMLGAADGATQFRDLKTRLAGNPEAWEGVKSSVVDAVLNRTQNAGILGGENIVSGAKMPQLVRQREGALREVFGDAGYENLVKVVDLQERALAAASLISEAGPNTAKKLTPILQRLDESMHNGSWMQMLILAGTVGAASGGLIGPHHIGTMMVAKWAHTKLQNIGIKNTHELVKKGLLDPEVGKAMMQRAIEADGKPNMGAMWKIITALEATHGSDHLVEENDRREGRAEGGAVKLEAAAHAASLLREADKIRKQHGAQTERLLKLPDEHVARALAVANEAIHG